MKKVFLIAVLLSAIPAQAGITQVQVNRNPAQATGTAYTCTLTNTTAGNLLLAWLNMSTTGRTYVSTGDDADGGTNAYTKDVGNLNLGGFGNFVVSSVAARGKVGTLTITTTINLTGGTGYMQCAEYSSTTGWPAAPANFNTSASGSCTTSCTTAAATATFSGVQAEELIIAFSKTNTGETVTKDTGFSDVTPSAATSAQDHSEYKVTSSTWTTTAVNYTYGSAPAAWGFVAAAYKNNASTYTPKHKVNKR